MGRGRIHPHKAKFKPYQGRKMGGAAGMATVIKEAVASFSGEPFNIFSLGTEISGTADAYFTRGSSVISVMNALGVEAMLPGNIEFSYGWHRLAELAQEAEFAFVSSNISEAGSGRTPAFLSPELLLNPGLGLKIAVVGITSPATPNLTARANVAGLEFSEPDESMRLRIEALRKSGADLVVMLTQYSRDRISRAEWQAIASAGPDICVMLDYEIEAPTPFKKDGVVVATVSGYNQTKEIDILDLELTPPPVAIVRISGRRIPVDHAEITPDPEVLAIAEQATRQTRAQRDSYIGSFADDYARSYNFECPVGNMITDAMRAETGCEIAIQNSGGIQSNIQAGDFTLGDLFSVMPFDNQMVQMELTGRDLLELLKISATRQRGVLQVSGMKYAFSAGEAAEVKKVTVGEADLRPDKVYSVSTNNFLADGGDNFTVFQRGSNIRFGRQQRDVVKDYIAFLSASGSVRLQVEGRIVVEE
jgi:2',3'-cyclic-nucleotide 2'-phosphodiesterase (5'-nucleotidase family)